MKATGIVRRVDELGRVVIPIELRNKFDIQVKDPIEIFVDGSSIVLKKYEPNCIFCADTTSQAAVPTEPEAAQTLLGPVGSRELGEN